MCFSADFGHWVYFGLSSNPLKNIEWGLNLIESVSEGFPSYSYDLMNEAFANRKKMGNLSDFYVTFRYCYELQILCNINMVWEMVFTSLKLPTKSRLFSL